MLNRLLVCICLFLSVPAVSQETALSDFNQAFTAYSKTVLNHPQNVVESLLAKPVSPSDSAVNQAQYHLILSRAYYNLTLPQKSLAQVQLALNLIEEHHQPWLFYNCQITLANALDLVGRAAEGMPGLVKAIEWSHAQQDAPLYLQGIFTRGILHTSLADYYAALKDFQLAYTLASNDPDSLSKPHVAAMIAQVYEYRSEPNLAIPYFEEAVNAHRKSNAVLDLSIALFGLGKANKNITELEVGKQQLQESANLAEQINDFQGLAYALEQLASIDVIQQNYAAAEDKFVRALAIFSQAGNQQMNYNVMMALVNMNIKTNELDKAESYLEQGERYLDREAMPVHSINFDELHARLLYLRQDFEGAYQALNRAFSTYRKFQNTNSTERLHQLRSNFEVQLTQHDNQVLSQQNAIQQLQLDSQQHRNIQLILISVFATIASGLLGIIVLRHRAHKRKLEKLASIDDLTGLFNRRQTLGLLEHQMRLAMRHRKGLCIAMLDLDFFKTINDTYGHLVGDKVLQQFATLCKASLRESDAIGRIGGEEFLLILNHSSLDDAYNVVEKLRAKLSEISRNLQLADLVVTVSGGIAPYHTNDSLEQLMLLADTALYRAKNNGRNQVAVCDRATV